MDTLYKKLKEFGKVRSNILLSKYTTFKIGGPARFFIEVEDSLNIIKLLDFLYSEGVNYFILAGGSNILFSDEGFDGVVVKIQNSDFKIQNNLLEIGAGTILGRIVMEVAGHSLSGLEWAAGIPGTVGGAVRGNAGAMGSDISKITEKVEVWRNGEVLVLDNKECNFGYRESDFKFSGDVILKVWLRLKKGDKANIMKEMQDYIMRRSKRTAPHPSAGSFFKNIKMEDYPGDKTKLPEKFLERGMVPAGWLIEECGLSGFSVGGAMVSNEHGNFLINFDKKATQSDVLELVEKVKEKVYNRFEVDLQPETEIVG